MIGLAQGLAKAGDLIGNGKYSRALKYVLCESLHTIGLAKSGNLLGAHLSSGK